VARKRHGKTATPKKKAAAVPVSSKPYNVLMTASAKTVYADLYKQSQAAEARGDKTNQHCTTFRMVDDAVRRMIPADPLNKKYALAAPLNGFFRISKGRTRICWVADSKTRSVLIAFISDTPRKEGDAKDPYIIFTRLVEAGFYHDELMEWQRLMQTPPDAPVN
jgi:hypothetical protein